MKKQFVYSGALVMVLALGVLFAACENGTQEVKGDVGLVYSKANAVSSVAAAIAGTYVTVTWDAVDNVSSYTVYVQQEGKKTVESGYNYSLSGQSTSADVDKWSATTSTSSNFIAGKKYRFGVRSSPFSNSGNVQGSDIVWSDYVQF